MGSGAYNHEQWNMSLQNMALFNVELNIGGKSLFLLGAAKGKINPISWDFFPVQAKLKEATPNWRLIDVDRWVWY